jgi:hypothetical protein
VKDSVEPSSHAVKMPTFGRFLDGKKAGLFWILAELKTAWRVSIGNGDPRLGYVGPREFGRTAEDNRKLESSIQAAGQYCLSQGIATFDVY